MAAADLASTNGHGLTAAEARIKAQEMIRAADAAGEPITGADVGKTFRKTDRWGRKQIAAARSARKPAAVPAGTIPRGETPGRRNTHRPRSGTADVLDGSAGAPEDRDTGRASPPAPGGAWLDSAIILTVALVAAVASYGHMLEVALRAGEPLWIARAFPITVDGLVLAALRRGRRGRWWLALGIAVSVAANMLARYPDLAAAAGPVVSAWPPLALFGTHRLLHARRTRR